jgi:hypothetical protein
MEAFSESIVEFMVIFQSAAEISLDYGFKLVDDIRCVEG